MALMSSVRIVKEFTYRGVVRQFSNRYHIGVNHPSDPAHWFTLVQNVMVEEATMWPTFSAGGVRVVAGFGLAPGSDVPVFEHEQVIDGSMPIVPWHPCPGDAAALAWYWTPDKSVRNHTVYLNSYYHAVGTDPNGSGDHVSGEQLAQMNAFAQHWLAGFSDGSTLYKRSRPDKGTLATSAGVYSEITHRDLPRS